MQAELKGSLIAEFPYICGRLFFFLRPSTDLTSHIWMVIYFTHSTDLNVNLI